MGRKKPEVDVRQLVLHEAGYKCANPACRGIITLDIHHIVRVADEGKNHPDNLLPLCPTCHALHHAGHIPQASVRAWKMLLLAMNSAFDRPSVDLLLVIHKLGSLQVSGDTVATYSSLIVSGLLRRDCFSIGNFANSFSKYGLYLTDKGRAFVEAWIAGDQRTAIEQLPEPPSQ